VAVRDDLDGVWNHIRKTLPPVRGVLHAAGVLEDAPLSQHDRGGLERVMAPKVTGAWNLHRLTEQRELDFFVVFSSAAAVLGSPGQGNYAAANAFLDGLAHYRRARGLPAVSVNWGPWEGLGMTAAVEAPVVKRWNAWGVRSIALEEGIRAMEQILRSNMTQAAMIPGSWSRQLRGGVAAVNLPLLADLAGANGESHAQAKTSAGPPELAGQLAQASPARRREILMDYIRTRLARILGLDASTTLDPRQPLNELGVDSLMALEMTNVLGDALGTHLPATLVYEYPTLEALTDYLSTLGSARDERPAPVGDPPPHRDEVGDVLAAIESLSDVEAEALLTVTASRAATE